VVVMPREGGSSSYPGMESIRRLVVTGSPACADDDAEV
jgi:hypothetical protein